MVTEKRVLPTQTHAKILLTVAKKRAGNGQELHAREPSTTLQRTQAGELYYYIEPEGGRAGGREGMRRSEKE